MKHLLLVRHAKSSWDNWQMKDFERPLSERGVNDAGLMRQHLSAEPQKILCSSATRTRETARLLIGEQSGSNIEYRDNLYMTSATGLMRAIQAVDDNYQCIMVITHNPGVGTFIDTYTELKVDKVPTCCILDAEYDITSWGEAEYTKPAKSRFIFPAMYR